VGPAPAQRQRLDSRVAFSPRLAFGQGPSDSARERRGQRIPKERFPKCFGSACSVYF